MLLVGCSFVVNTTSVLSALIFKRPSLKVLLSTLLFEAKRAVIDVSLYFPIGNVGSVFVQNASDMLLLTKNLTQLHVICRSKIQQLT